MLIGAVVVVDFTVVVVSAGAVVVVVFVVVVVVVPLGAVVLVVPKGVAAFVVPVGAVVVGALVVVVVLVGAEFEFPSVVTVTEDAETPDPLDEVGVEADATAGEVVVVMVDPSNPVDPEGGNPAAPFDDWATSVPGNVTDVARSEATTAVVGVGG